MYRDKLHFFSLLETTDKEVCSTYKRAIAMNKKRSSSKGVHYQKAEHSVRPDSINFSKLVVDLAETGKNFYSRGWVLGTSGNFSAVISREPLRLAITSTGLDKSSLTPAQFLEIDGDANIVRGEGQPSAEALLHLSIVRCVNAGAVLHTHSVWSTVLSGTHALRGGVELEGYEMLKGLRGVGTHQHSEWLPILENSQDMVELAQRVSTTLRELSDIHGFLVRQHGFYTWGASLQEAKRHIEILEFLMEVLVRSTPARTPCDPGAGRQR
jgi:methylthioribulose-1-phosphate dehydratase